ncbi:predicted protein [Uncinocarpus reesii 1704]|uniref:non-specific serine/threonine protein kinase n=1 Tax=Uncinocarpus reesii (strain UAMH 1704) TaxID=336963 RepID=C4JL99_UNCRE|nr:uncharacterized protein UREG_03607 [Uncinocarpus reesii 1704]EEP78761.1 predicted protein [Uncinocarpus reesii 1704]
MSSSRALRIFPSSGFELIEKDKLIDEERLPAYYPEKYYPVRLGEVLGERYQILGKLGFGTTSTVWLARDLQTDAYATLKLYVTGAERGRELNMYKRIEEAISQTDHPGRTSCIRTLLGSFQVKGPHDLQTTNLILSVSRPEIFPAFEEAQISHPVPRKVVDDNRNIYTTRPLNLCNGLPLICDFGAARTFEEAGTPGEDVMPDVYKAPEVILHMKWDRQIDIWNVAMVVWHLLMGEPLFKGRSPCGTYQDDRVHMAEMVALMGNPPLEFTQRSHMSRALWDENGR